MAQPYHGGYHPTNDLSVILGQARAAEMIQAKLNQPDSFEIHPITGCLLSLTSLNNNGYAVGKRYSNDLRRKAQNPGLDMRNKGTNILLHRAAYLALHGTLQFSLPLCPPPSSPPLPSSSSRPGASSSSNQTLGHHPRPSSSSDIQPPRRRRRLQSLSSDGPPSDQPPSGSRHGPQTSSSGLPTSDFVVNDDAPIEYESDESDEN
jgi:hypothetical protein